MNLAEKLRALRAQEGLRRGLWRSLTQREVVTALRQELGLSLSQAYLSQLEGGKRIHLTNASREAFARFYRVHPGYLVNDLADPSPSTDPHISQPTSAPFSPLRESLALYGQHFNQPAHNAASTLESQRPAAHEGWFGWLATGAPMEHLEAAELLCRLPQRSTPDAHMSAGTQAEAHTEAESSMAPPEASALGAAAPQVEPLATAALRLPGAPPGVASDRPDLRRVLTLMEALLRLPENRLCVIEAALGLAAPTGAPDAAVGVPACAGAQQPTPTPRRSTREHQD